MTALTATVEPELAGVSLTVTGAPAGPVTITRTDDNGVRLVRLLTGQEPIAGTMQVTDYEPALTGSLYYEARDASGGLATPAGAPTLAGVVTRAQLSLAVLPQVRYSPTLITRYTSDRPSRTTFHDVIDRDTDLLTVRPLALRRGQLELWAESYPVARQIEAVCASGEVVHLRQTAHPGLDMYFAAAAVSAHHVDEPDTIAGLRWVVAIDYREQAPPTGPLLGSFGWNLEALAAYGTLAQVKADFATLADVTAGP